MRRVSILPACRDWRGPLVALTWLCLCALLPAADIYFTEFEEFAIGPDEWAGTNGWLGSSLGLGVHGIDHDMVPGLDNTAFIGASEPAARFVTVVRPVGVDPATNNTPFIEFESLLGVEDSTNGFRDSFFITFYNIAGGRLASLRFNNEATASFGIWRSNGAGQFDTGIDFIHGELHLLHADLDLSQNAWTAYLDGIPLFADVPFNATGQDLTFGSAAAEWQISDSSYTNFGDNWMLVADWSIRAIPEGTMPLSVNHSGTGGGTNTSVSWEGDPGFDYLLLYSSNLVDWAAGLPGSTFSNVASTGTISFTDTTASNVTRRFYRVERSATP